MRIKDPRKAARKQLDSIHADLTARDFDPGGAFVLLFLAFDAVNYCYSVEDRNHKERWITSEVIADLLRLAGEAGVRFEEAGTHWPTYPVLPRLQALLDRLTAEGDSLRYWEPSGLPGANPDGWYRYMNLKALLREMVTAQRRQVAEMVLRGFA